MENKSKKPPKGSVKFNISLSEEQKRAKEQMIKHPYSFVVGKAGSGKTLLAVQVALDMFFKRQYNKIIITRPTVATEDNGFLPGTEVTKINEGDVIYYDTRAGYSMFIEDVQYTIIRENDVVVVL